MSMYYSHLLVPTDSGFRPPPATVAEFLEDAIGQGLVGNEAERVVLVFPSPAGGFFWGTAHERGEKRTGMLPSRERGRPTTWTRCSGREEFARLLADEPADFQATVWSEERPRCVALRGLRALHDGEEVGMDDTRFEHAFYVALTCHATSSLVSMSDDGHYTDASRPEFGATVAADAIPATAIAENPHEEQRYETAGIGAARFWISLTFGNYVFPSAASIREHALDLALPELVSLAKRHFRADFGQTCSWG